MVEMERVGRDGMIKIKGWDRWEGRRRDGKVGVHFKIST